MRLRKADVADGKLIVMTKQGDSIAVDDENLGPDRPYEFDMPLGTDEELIRADL